MTTRGLRAAVLALAALLALTSCGRIETVLAFGATANGVDRSVVLDPPAKAAKASCAGKLTNDNRFAPPAGLPRPSDAAWLQARALPGKQVYLGWVLALDPRLRDLREEFVGEGTGRGYTVDAGAWSRRVLDVRYSGRADVQITLQPFCRDRLAIRYVVSSLAPAPPELPTPAAASSRVCPDLDDVSAPLTGEQLGLAYPSGARTLLIGAAATADVYTALVPGAAGSVGTVRDGLTADLAKAGYLAAALPVAAGRAQTLLAGARLGSVVVQPWCRDTLAVRYELAPSEDVEGPAASAARPCNGRDTPEPVADMFPSDLVHAGQTVLTERRATAFRAWTTITPVAGAAVGQLGGDIAGLLQGRGARLLPMSAPDGMRAATAHLGPSWVLVVVRPQCLDHVAEQYVVTP
jgi:hypothetical protein